MSAKINNFINLGGAGDGSESLPVYGVYWKPNDELYVFEIADTANPFYELNKLHHYYFGATSDTSRSIPEFKNLIFHGAVTEEEFTYKDTDRNITLITPVLPVAKTLGNAPNEGLSGNIFGFADDDLLGGNVLFNALGITKGVFIGMYDSDDFDMIIGFILGDITTDYQGYGFYRSATE